jgi:hypothetical protein
VDDRFGVPRWTPRERMAEHLPAGCGLGFFVAPLSAWSTARFVAASRAACDGGGGGAADDLSLLITLLPLLAIGYGAVFAFAFAVLRRVAAVEGWVAFVFAVLVLAVVAPVTRSVLVDLYVPAGTCGP